jgi:predicted permease
MTMPVIAVIVVVAMVSGALARQRSERPDRYVAVALDLVMLVFVPLIGYAFASRLVFNTSTIVGIVCGYAVIGAVGVLAWQITDRRMHLSRAQQGGVVLGSVLANTGYLGLPVALTLLDRKEFPQSVAWDALISMPMALLIAPFLAAAFSPSHQHAHVGQQLVAVMRRAPAIPALLAGLLVPDAWVPHWLVELATVAVYAILPVGFFAVGVTLMRLRRDDARPPRAAVGVIVLLRNVVAPGLFVLVGMLVLPQEPRAFALQAAMPCGLNALFIGHAFDLDTGVIATAIAWSTALVLAAALVGGLLL